MNVRVINGSAKVHIVIIILSNRTVTEHNTLIKHLFNVRLLLMYAVCT